MGGTTALKIPRTREATWIVDWGVGRDRGGRYGVAGRWRYVPGAAEGAVGARWCSTSGGSSAARSACMLAAWAATGLWPSRRLRALRRSGRRSSALGHRDWRRWRSAGAARRGWAEAGRRAGRLGSRGRPDGRGGGPWRRAERCRPVRDGAWWRRPAEQLGVRVRLRDGPRGHRRTAAWPRGTSPCTACRRCRTTTRRRRSRASCRAARWGARRRPSAPRPPATRGRSGAPCVRGPLPPRGAPAGESASRSTVPPGATTG